MVSDWGSLRQMIAIIVSRLSCLFTGEMINAGKGGNLFVQTAHVFKFPILLADVGPFQVVHLGRVVSFLHIMYFANYSVMEGLEEVSVLLVLMYSDEGKQKR